MLENYLTRTDFVRLACRGPDGIREEVWCAAYREGLVNVPLSWHWAAFHASIGMQLMVPLACVVDWLTCHF